MSRNIRKNKGEKTNFSHTLTKKRKELLQFAVWTRWCALEIVETMIFIALNEEKSSWNNVSSHVKIKTYNRKWNWFSFFFNEPRSVCLFIKSVLSPYTHKKSKTGNSQQFCVLSNCVASVSELSHSRICMPISITDLILLSIILDSVKNWACDCLLGICCCCWAEFVFFSLFFLSKWKRFTKQQNQYPKEPPNVHLIVCVCVSLSI